MLQIHVLCCHPNYFKSLLKNTSDWVAGVEKKKKGKRNEGPISTQMQEVTEMQGTFDVFLQAQYEQVAII